jgi:hypothetical protein
MPSAVGLAGLFLCGCGRTTEQSYAPDIISNNVVSADRKMTNTFYPTPLTPASSLSNAPQRIYQDSGSNAASGKQGSASP